MRPLSIVVFSVWCLGAVAAVAADPTVPAVGGTIQSGDVAFVRTSASFGALPAAELTGVAAPGTSNQLFELGWWIRLSTAPAEVPLGNPTTESYNANQSNIEWPNAGGTGLSIQEVAIVSDGHASGQPADGGQLTLHLFVNNYTASNISATLTHYFDYDVDGTFSNDSAILGGSYPLLQIRDGSSVAYMRFHSPSPGSWSVAPYSTLRDSLNDSGVTNLDNCCAPFGPADFTGGLQWNISLGSLEFYHLIVYHAVNATLTCLPASDLASPGVFCDNLESGNEAFWSTSLP